jgi:hypothetical protein
MQFDRDEFLLLSRRGSVPTSSTGPPGGPPSPLRDRRKRGGASRLRSLAHTAVRSLRGSRGPVRQVHGVRRDR